MDLNDLRKRILSGGGYTKEELHTAISELRVVRSTSGEKSISRRTEKAAAAPISDSQLDAELNALMGV